MSAIAGRSVLVTGASGFLGAPLVRTLVDRGARVRIAARGSAAAAPRPGCEVVNVPDPSRPGDWSSALAGIDTVFHVAALNHVPRGDPRYTWDTLKAANVDVTAALAAAARRAAVARFVFVSSIGVHGASYRQGPITERSALVPANDYSRSKLDAERALDETLAGSRTAGVSLRPPLVYGPGVKGNMLTLVKAVRAGLWLPFGGLDNRLSFIGVDNCADALVQAAVAPAAAVGGKAFVLADDETISAPDLIRAIAAGLGRGPRLFRIPPGLLALVGRVTGKSDQVEKFTTSYTVDASAFRAAALWRAPRPMREGLEAMGRSFGDGTS